MRFFGNISCRDFSLLLNILKLDWTLLLVLKVPTRLGQRLVEVHLGEVHKFVTSLDQSRRKEGAYEYLHL